jgi:radical SAM protein with 4Fe4S-binding SPASM domain
MNLGLKMQQNRLKDGLHFLSMLTVKRILNAAKVLGSYYWSRISRKPMHFGLPLSIAIEPTTACNLRCPECPSGLRSFSRPTGMLKMETFSSLIDELHPSTSYLTLYFQGEPYLNPDFFNMVRYATDKKMYVATSTNAHYLDEKNAEATIASGLSRLIVSIDGTTQDVYESYRIGGKLSTVMQGVQNIVNKKKEMKSATPHIIFQFLVVKPNEHQIDDVKQLANENGVDEVKLKTAQLYDYKYGNPLIPDKEKYARYRKLKNGTYEVKNKLSNNCWKMWSSSVLTWDGRVIPCCFDKDAKHQFGQLDPESFSDIWNNKAYVNFRKAILKSRKNIDICRNCTEGTKVWA